MAVRPVLRMGDARLSQVAERVSDFTNGELQQLLVDMRDTMKALDGAGLAAPQIGVGLRVLIFGMPQLEQQAQAPKNSRYPDAIDVPETVLINPFITPQDDKIDAGWEGCLSVPGLRGLVPRHNTVRYQGYDEFGALIDRTVSGFHARVVQHECDHLDGILYTMRIRNMRNFGYSDVLFPDAPVQDE